MDDSVEVLDPVRARRRMEAYAGSVRHQFPSRGALARWGHFACSLSVDFLPESKRPLLLGTVDCARQEGDTLRASGMVRTFFLITPVSQAGELFDP